MPFSGFEDFDDCLSTMQTEEGHDEETARNICGALQQEAKSDAGDADALLDALRDGAGLVADVGVDLVSGVDVPAVNSKWVMMKSGGGRRGHDYRSNVPVLVEKDDGDAEKRITHAAAMVPREPDKEGDVVPPAVVENAAHGFVKNDGGVDTDHSLIEGDGEVVESWIEPNERTWDLPDGGSETYPAGTWMVGIEWGAEAWDRIKSGELSGLSIYGMAEHVPLGKAAKCVECGDSLSAAKAETTDSGKREASDTGDMGTETDGDGTDAGGDGGDGPTIGEVAASVESLTESVESVKDAVETQKQAVEDALDIVGNEYGMAGSDVGELLAAVEDAGVDEALSAIASIESAGAEEVANEGDKDDDEDDDEMEASADDVEKRTDDAAIEKGTSGEGAREAAIEQKQKSTAASGGMPSYAEVAEQRGDN